MTKATTEDKQTYTSPILFYAVNSNDLGDGNISTTQTSFAMQLLIKLSIIHFAFRFLEFQHEN